MTEYTATEIQQGYDLLEQIGLIIKMCEEYFPTGVCALLYNAVGLGIRPERETIHDTIIVRNKNVDNLDLLVYCLEDTIRRTNIK